MTGLIFAYITCKSALEAEEIGSRLVDEGLAACVNILPGMVSIYKWQGKTERADEAVLIAKTAKAKFKKLEVRVKELRSYDNPCIVAFDIADGSEEFLEWIKSQVK